MSEATPTTANRTLRRLPNSAYRPREYLTEQEVEKLIEAARKRGRWISRKPQFTLFHDSIVWLAIAFDAVLKFAIAFWQLCQNLIRTTRSIRQSNRCAETDHLSDAKAVDDGGTMVSCSHNRICFLTFQDTLPTGSRAASQCRVPVAVSCIRSSILIRGCAIQNSAAIASSNIEAVSKESAISSPQALFSGLPSL